MILLDNLIKDNCINHDATCSREGGVFSSAPKLLNNVHAAAAAAAPSLIMLPHLYSPDSVTYLGAAESAYSVCMCGVILLHVVTTGGVGLGVWDAACLWDMGRTVLWPFFSPRLSHHQPTVHPS